MKYEEITRCPTKVITPQQREDYYEFGYLVLPKLIAETDLAVMRSLVDDIVEKSRNISEPSRSIDLEKGHCTANPKLRRVAYIDDDYPEFWEICADSVITDVAADLLGPNVRYRELMLNFKWSDGGSPVKWHQDFVFYPHTNTGTMQFLLFLEDVDHDQGPLQIIPKSHKGKLYEHYDSHGNWTGAIREEDLEGFDKEKIVEVTGESGTVSVHHSCTIHGSGRNNSDRGRPALVITYAAADAIPYTAAAYPASRYRTLVRGVDPGYAHHEELNVPMPPDWSGGYTSIYEHQLDE